MVFQEDFIPQPKRFISTRFFIAAAAAAFLSVTLVGCGIALNEGNGNPDGNLKLNDGGADCIEKSLPKIERYFVGTATAAETTESWNCVNTALKMFHDNVRGQDPNFYTPEELRAFLQGYFLGNIKLTDRFMDEAFRLKQIFLGGERRRLSRGELQKLMAHINLLRDETVRLLPHLNLVLQKAAPGSPEATPEKLQAAKIALNEMTDVIGQVFAHAEAVYSEEHARALLHEVQGVFAQGGSTWKGPESAVAHLPTFFVFKSFLLHPTINAIFPDEWGGILNLLSRLYGIHLHIKYLVQPAKDVFHGEGLAHVNQLMSEVFGTLQNAVNNKSSKVIGFDLIDQVVGQLYFLKLIDSNFMQDHTLKNLVRTVVGKIYHPSVKGVRPIAAGIDTKVLNLMKADAFGFTDMQATFDSIESKVQSSGAKLTFNRLKSGWPATAVSSANHSKQIYSLLHQRRPQVLSNNSIVMYNDAAFSQVVTPTKFTEMNWRRMLISLFARGYSADSTTVEANGLVPDPEFRQLYMDFRELAAELKFLDPNENTIWKSTADESMIFFLSSDGKRPVTVAEGYDFLSLALGAGKISEPIYEEAKKQCKLTGFVDTFKNPLVETACYKKLLINNFARYFQALPDWPKAAAALDATKLEKFQDNLQYITMKHYKKPEMGVQSGDIGKTASVFQYAESVFWRYDTDKSGTLNLDESLVAFPIFREYLSEAADMTDEGDLTALFTYLLRYKRAPSTILQKAEFLWWKMNKSTWKYEVGRIDIIEIIAAMQRQDEAAAAKDSATPQAEEEQLSMLKPLQVQPVKTRQRLYSFADIKFVN